MQFKYLYQQLINAFKAVFPLALIVLMIALILGIPFTVLLDFLLGALLLILGLTIFGIGSHASTNAMAEAIGIFIVKRRKLLFFIAVSFLVGFLITIAEPALWVLADQFKSVVEPLTLVIAVALGIGVMLVVALVRILTRIQLRTLFAILYLGLFALAGVVSLVSPDFIPVAFDSGGVTTGALAAPFVMALGIGISRTHDESGSQEDSFGLIGLISVGPMVAVLVLGFFVPPSAPVLDINSTFLDYFLLYTRQMAVAILPFIMIYFFFQRFAFHQSQKVVIKTLIGFASTYVGIVLFLTGANAGLVNMGYFVGMRLTTNLLTWLIVPVGMIFGYTSIAAEPAVIALNKQIDEVSGGSISSQLMMTTMGIGTSLALALSMVRLLTGISIWWLILPIYLAIIILAFLAPRLFYSIAFDSGGAVSGALTTTFLMPFAQGAAIGLGANGLADAFGLVALVAAMPILMIVLLGVVYQQQIKTKQMVIQDVEILHLKGD